MDQETRAALRASNYENNKAYHKSRKFYAVQHLNDALLAVRRSLRKAKQS